MQPEPNKPTPENLDDSPDGLDKLIPETTEMEVHHHPHVEKKNFKEYILEGLMIFVAVTMGFFAENIREHIGDSEKERMYAASLKEDLMTDTTKLTRSIFVQSKVIEAFDSLRILLNKPVLDTAEINTAYYFARISTLKANFKANDKTLIQLKSTGDFRLIKNALLISKITEYQRLYDDYYYNSDYDKTEQDHLAQLIPKMFDPNVFETMVTKAISEKGSPVIKPTGINIVDTKNAEVLREFIYYLHLRKRSFRLELGSLQKMHDLTSEIIEIIKKEYSIEN